MLYLYGKVSLPVAYGKTIKELLGLGGYRSVCPDICDGHFPPEIWEQHLVATSVQFKIFGIKKVMEFEGVLMELGREHCHGASLREGLAFGIEKPRIHQKISLVLPGSFWRNQKTAFKTRQVPELSSISNSRHMYLCQLDRVWPAGTFFLATALR